jgi:hypothetical protein
MRSSRRRYRVGWIVAVALGLVYVLSLRYAIEVSPSARWAVGVMGGAATLRVRDQATVSGAPAVGRVRLTAMQPKLIHFYSHRYAPAWWVHDAQHFWWWIAGPPPGPAPGTLPPGVVIDPRLGDAVIDYGNGRIAAGPGVIITTGAPVGAPFLLEVPLWMPLLLLLAPLIVSAVRRRVRKGRCLSCGYDLRGMSGEKCPECGAAVQPSAPPVVR